MLSNRRTWLFLLLLVTIGEVYADNELVLVLDAEKDLLSLSHNIDQFLFAPTRNYQATGEDNINNMQAYPVLANNLSVTGLLRMNGEVVGFATEQEIVSIDPDSQHPVAESLWVIRLNHPDLQGFISVLQKEDGIETFSLAEKVNANQEKEWPDRWYRFLSTSGEVRVQLASGDLARYQGGIFREYNYLNPSDLANFGHFRARIEFVISPKVND